MLKKFFLKKSFTMPKKLKGGTHWDFSTSVLSENSKKMKGGHFGEFFFEKMSHRAENTLRKYPLVPLSFLDDVKILLRMFLREYFKFAK